MSLEHLLSRRATVHRYGAGAADDHGNAVRVLEEDLEVACALEQIQPSEILIGRETYIATHKIALPPRTPLDGGDEITVEDATFEVVGDPSRGFTPAGEHHVEALLREIR
jgi:hypothetical protein